MKALIIGMLIAVMLVGSASAQDARIALFANSPFNDNDAELPTGEIFNLGIYYIQGSGPVLGHACEFRLVLSTLDAAFLMPVWSGYIKAAIGDVESGISIAANVCMGDCFGVQYDIVHLGTVPVWNHADPDTFTVSLVGHPGVDPPAVRITACNDGHSIHEVQGGTFTFNSVNRLQIFHTPIADCVTGQDIYVLWEVSDNVYGVETTCLYYRQVGELGWSELCEDNPVNPIAMTIPGGEVTEGSLEYFITATNGIGTTAYNGTSNNPHMISVCEDAVQIIHTPIVACVTGQDIYVLWEVLDNCSSVETTCLYYRQVGEPGWGELCEDNPVNPIVMTIPGDDVTESILEYFIAATNGIGTTAYNGTSNNPHMISVCEDTVTCEQPMLTLVDYQSLSYEPPIWQVAVEVFNSGPGTAHDVTVMMNADIPWLIIPDPGCHYGDIAEGETSTGQTDGYRFDLSNHPGGSYGVWFDVTYEDSCANHHRLRLDPEFDLESAEDGRPSEIPSYNLFQNYPNPFNPTTTISFSVPRNSHATIRIFDVSGSIVRTLADGMRNAGINEVVWNGRDDSGREVSSGIYLYLLVAGDFVQTKKMVLLR